ncbi:MAG: ABC transporter substrate-binding protein [Nitratireductor sp.]|nr:ABC transporter substrate-binding protein [Nitratireductor sp.]
MHMTRLALILTLFFLAAMPAGAAERLTVLLDWFVNPDHAALVIAKERGMFEEAGLDVSLVPPADPSAPPRLVAAGQADLAISYQPQLHVQVDGGLPLARIGALVQVPLNSLVVLEARGIQSLGDLKGKTVGYSVGGFEDAVLGAMLATAGLTLEDVKLVNINFSLSPSLITGNVDAVIGAFRNFELNQLEIEGHKGKAFLPEEHGVPAYEELIVVSHKDKTGDPRFATFLKVVEQATLWLADHPDEGWEMFVAAHPDLDDELNKRAWRDTLPKLSRHPASLDAAGYQAFAEFMRDAGLIQSVPPLETYAVELK